MSEIDEKDVPVKLPDLTDRQLISKAKKACNPTQVEYVYRTHILKEMVRRFDPKKAQVRAKKAAHKAPKPASE